jgi:CO/xanthine dehydrogenase FAD-binding subunit
MPITVEIPESVTDVVGALGDGAIVLAGGTEVMPRINTEPHDVGTLVSLRRAGLSGIEVAAGEATIGAATTLARVGADERLAFLRPVIESIASPTIRNLATVGGNLFVEQPYGDLAVALLALDAQVDIAGPGGSETRGVAHVGGLPACARGRSPLGTGHVVTAVRFALPAEFRYTKAMRRRLNSASIVTVAAVLGAEPRLALGGAGGKPVRSASAEAVLAAGPLDRERAEAAGRAALDDAEPPTDAYASAWYRARVLPVHVRRALIGETA